MIFRSSLLFLLALPALALADTIPGQALVDFESGSAGSTVTASIMTSGTKGQTWSGWKTLSDPGGGVQGSTPYLTISSAASYQLYTPASINGTVYAGSGTRGLRETMNGDNAVQLTLPSPGYQLSVGFYFRFNGPQINYSPRDVVGLRSDPSGGYQFLQIYDGPQPYFHTHWQPYSSGSGIGNNVNFNRNQWYWVTMKHVAGGGTFQIRFYDPANNYALVGTSSGAVSSGTQGCTAIQIGCIKYSSGGSQSVDFDNIIINTSGTFPLGPGSGGSLPANQPPVVAASATPRSGTAPLSVAFSSAGSSDPEGASLSYSWTFGDGGTSTAANPSHTYQSAGTYTAKLTVSDGSSSATSGNLTITVSAPANQPPVAGASATPRSGTAPLSVAFSSAGSSDPEGASLSYSWTFGDGGTSTAANPSHTYQSAGTYTAKLTVSDGTNSATSGNLTITVSAPANQPPVAGASATPQTGTAPLSVAFSSAGSSDPEGASLSYSWTFGDGGTSTAANPSHTYQSAGTYTAKLTVSDGTNSATSGNLTITVSAPANQPPVAGASATPQTGTAPLSVAFSSAGSSDPEGASLSYSWTFGDGGTSTAANPSHTYQSAGTYTAKLTVSDGTNSATSGNLTITASAPANQPPVASANASPKSGVVPLAVSFSSAGSSDPEGTALSYSWNFGDGTTSATANPSHTYSTAGTYSARLTVSDGVNSTTSSAVTITASAAPANQAPVAVAGATPKTGDAPLNVSFSSAGSSDPEGAALTCSWNFGDGATSTSANPSHIYSAAGDYVAHLTVSDGTNTSVASTVTINVTGMVAAYGFEETSGSTVTDAAANRSAGTITTASRVPGKFGKALSFNGTDSLVAISNTTALALSSNMTLEAWVNPTTADNTWMPVIFKPYSSSQISYVMQGRTPMNGAPSVYVSPSANNVLSGVALPTNTWSHLAATYDGTTIRLYTNGVLAASQAQTGAVSSSSEPLTIGGNATFQAYWKGLVDEVRIYNRALSAAEIQADAAKPVDSSAATPPVAPENLHVVPQ